MGEGGGRGERRGGGNENVRRERKNKRTTA